MRFVFFLILVFTSSAFGIEDIDAVSAICSPSNMQMDKIKELVAKVSGGEKFKRVECGILGEGLRVCRSCVSDITPEQMKIITPMFNKKEHRDWHVNWHMLRLQFQQQVPNEKLQNDVDKAVQEKSFKNVQEATKLACKRKPLQPGLSREMYDNSSHGGETFFYMHREMLKMVNAKLVSAGKPCVKGWSSVPLKVDQTFEKFDAGALSRNTEAMRNLEKIYKSETFLKGLPLNELGCQIENGLHGDLHMTWRNADPCERVSNKNQEKCNNLVDLSSAPLNPHFWMLHGYVDSYVGLWLKANNYQEISTKCEKRPKCYEWKGDWMGKHPDFEL